MAIGCYIGGGEPSREIRGKIKKTRGGVFRDLCRDRGRGLNYAVALLLKMASGSELPEYSSPAKRRKIDCDVYGVQVRLDLDFQQATTTSESPHGDLEGIY